MQHSCGRKQPAGRAAPAEGATIQEAWVGASNGVCQSHCCGVWALWQVPYFHHVVCIRNHDGRPIVDNSSVKHPLLTARQLVQGLEECSWRLLQCAASLMFVGVHMHVLGSKHGAKASKRSSSRASAGGGAAGDSG